MSRAQTGGVLPGVEYSRGIHRRVEWREKVRGRVHGSNYQRLVLVAHGDGTITDSVSRIIKGQQCEVLRACCASEAFVLCAEHKPGLVLIDLFLPATVTRGIPAEDNKAATEVLRAARKANGAVQVSALVNGSANLDVCCQAVLEGFNGFLDCSSESFAQELCESISQSASRYEHVRESQSSALPSELLESDTMVGVSKAWRGLLRKLWRTSMISDVSVLIQGESGTGKQVLAESIHRLDSKRNAKHFATVNCAAITGTLAESELFGHCKGAFTGATSNRLGYFRSCDGGTLFLDEISELGMNLQPKLLRVLQEGRVLPVGADHEFATDVRVIASSNKPLGPLVAEGKFRLDLYQRLKVVSLAVPPLHERLEDVPLLLDTFLKRYRHYYGGQIRSIDPQVYDILGRTKLAGNVRELENIVRQALVLKESGTRLEVYDLPAELLSQTAAKPSGGNGLIPAEVATSLSKMLAEGKVSLSDVVEGFEKTLISQAMDKSDGTQSELAQRLGLTRRTFYNKLQKYSILQP